MESKTTGTGRDAKIAAGLAVGFLGLYLRTLCPTVYLGDSGEICTAIVTGGVPHPPGYPLFSLLGRLALALVPFGEPAFRIGCLVATAAASAVTVVYLIGRELDCAPWAAASGAAALGVGYSFWSQSTRVEVYSLHVFLAACLLLGGLRYRRTGALRDLALAVLAGSLGLAHHLTIVLLGPALLTLCGRSLAAGAGRARRLGLILALLPTGPALYLFLLVWARRGPLQAWGHPVSLALLWNHATARIFRIFLSVPDCKTAIHGIEQAGSLFVDSFPFLSWLLPLAGAVMLWRRDRQAAAAILLIVLAISAYNLCYQIPDIPCYYLTVWMAAACLLSVALDALGRQAPPGAVPRVAVGALGVMLIGATLVRNFRACDLSQVTWMREYARQKLDDAAPGSVLLVQGDDDINPIWYLHDVLGVRPDVIPVDRAQIGGRTWGLYDYDPSLWYLYRLRLQGVAVSIQAPRDPDARRELADDGCLIRLLSGPLKDRPLAMTFLAPGTRFYDWARARYAFVPAGVVFQLHPREQPVDLAAALRREEQLWARIRLPDLSQVRTDQEIAPDYVRRQYALMLTLFGSLYQHAGQPAQAETEYRHVLGWAPGYGPAVAAMASVRGARRQAAG